MIMFIMRKNKKQVVINTKDKKVRSDHFQNENFIVSLIRYQKNP